MEETKKTKSGSGLIFAVVLLFVILGMVITLSSITVLETKMNQKTKSSVGAFYNSESGVEWALNKIANQPNADTTAISSGFSSTGFNTDGSAKCPSGFSADCKVYFLGEDGKVLATSNTVDKIKAVRSIGTEAQGGTQRAIEAAVAAGGIEIIGASDSGASGKSGDEACAAKGKRCIRVMSYNFVKVDAACPSGTHCAHVCDAWYNTGLAGVEQGQEKDNIHGCNAILGEQNTYMDSGVVQCNAFFSAFCQ